MKLLKRIAITICATVFVFALVPASSFAVDPVSASTMANALAQAITAYGASQGVSMTYDVTNTDGIGEGVRDLWDQFKQDVNDNNVPTYDSLAVTVWSTLFTKVNNHVGINLDDTSVGFLDAFWNWLLTGPAEMTKVDNTYYQWSLNQDGTVSPVTIFSSNGLAYIPSVSSSASAETIYNNGLFIYSMRQNSRDVERHYAALESNVYCFRHGGYVVYVSESSSYVKGAYYNNNTYYNDGTAWELLLDNYGTYSRDIGINANATINTNIPEFADYASGMAYFSGVLDGTNPTESISVQPYVGDAIPQDVYIPDNDDVNYAPLPYVGELDIPWDDSLFGDGTGSLSDAQSQAIADDLSSVIEQDSTLTLAEDAPIVNPPSEVYIPLLPVTLPSFNFSFSGIWHYVVTWVGSLGSWLTLMFSVWSSLPYAIVVPVYASAVVVIIIGTLKRFL